MERKFPTISKYGSVPPTGLHMWIALFMLPQLALLSFAAVRTFFSSLDPILDKTKTVRQSLFYMEDNKNN